MPHFLLNFVYYEPAWVLHSKLFFPQPGQTPRRSRRLAGVQAEFQMDELEKRSKKKAMHTLHIIDEQEGIDQQAQSDYNKLFGEPLSNVHVEALAALFKWSLPDVGVFV